MYISGCPVHEIGTLQDSLCQAVWLRREQFRIFETLINVLASGLSLDPKLSKRVEELTDEYINLVLPGTKELRKNNDSAFVEKTHQILNDIAAMLAASPSSTIKVT